MADFKRINVIQMEEQTKYAFLPMLPETLEKPSWQSTRPNFILKNPRERFQEIQKRNNEFLASLNQSYLKKEHDVRSKKISYSSTLKRAVELMKDSSERKKHFRRALVQLIFNREDDTGKALTPVDDQSILRYRYYIENGVDTRNVAEMKEGWFERILEKLTNKLIHNKDSMLKSLLDEIINLYSLSSKKATVDFVLQNVIPLCNINKSSEAFYTEKPWRNALRSIFRDHSRNLHVTSTCLRNVLNLWNSGMYNQSRLIRKNDFHSMKDSLDLRAFDEFCSKQMEECIDHLENRWLNEVHRIFMKANRHELVPKLDDTIKHRAFFDCISTLMTVQVQQVALDSLQDFIDLLIQPSTSKRIYEHPGIIINLVLENVSIGFDPSFSEFQKVLITILDRIVEISKSIHRIECKLYSKWDTNKDARKCFLQPIVLPEILYSHKISITRLVGRERLGPELHSKNFDQYSDIINKKAEIEVNEFIDGEHSFDEYCAMVEKYKNLSEDIKYKSTRVIRMGLFEVHCEKLIDSMSNRATDLSKKLLDRMVKDHNDINMKLELEYHSIANKGLTKPLDTVELMDLVSYIHEARETIIPRLEEGLREAMRRLLYLGDHTDLTMHDMDVNSMLFSWADRIHFVLQEHRRIVEEKTERFIEMLKVRKERLNDELQSYSSVVKEFKSFGEVIDVEKYLKKAQALDMKLQAASKKIEDINFEENSYELPKTSYPIRNEIASTLEPYLQLYTATVDFNAKHEHWMNGPMNEVDPESVARDVEELSKIFMRLEKHFSDLSSPKKIAFKGKTKVDAFKVHLSIVMILFNPGLRERHWQQVSGIIQVPLKQEDDLTLMKLINLDIDSSLFPALESVSEAASKEHALEKALGKMKKEWENMEFTVISYRESGTFILAAIDDIQVLLDDHIVKSEAMKASTHIKPFENDMKDWASKLALLLEVLDQWLQVQATWLYMEPIFSSPDIIQQMPEEGRRFNTVDKTWRTVMKQVNENRKVMTVIDIEKLLEKLKKSNETLELVQKGLNEYLEKKRFYFPRFFFLSNEEILEILSETKDPTRVQPHLKKCFEGIARLSFTSPHLDITHMQSSEGELVSLCEIISTSKVRGQVEKWLLELETVMLASVRKVIKQSIEDYNLKLRKDWVLDWPGQAILCTSQLYWTVKMHEAISSKNPDSMSQFLDLSNRQIEDIVELVRGKLPEQNRTTLRALIVIDVHSRDVTSDLIKKKIRSEDDFGWTSQLRYYYSAKDNQLTTKMINCELKYGYEYLGNTSRLVITPLTDRCYRTLFGALNLHLGGAPEGPAGTGKTETTKDLARAVAKQCVVFNCSDGLDHVALGKFFKGLASCGAWSCFDEFNRIDIEVLSVVAQQILTIQMAINSGLEKFVFEGSEIKLDPTCSVFITMNPGYAGRSELPDNLKALFRPVAMMVPDYTLISEISLYSEGFIRAKTLAVKVVATYRLCSEQLSTQPHYDYGMRAVKSVLLAAGKLKRQYPDMDEDQLVLQSIIDVNLPKFKGHDLPLFKGIIVDLFPTVKVETSDDDPLKDSIVETCQELNLQTADYFVEKIVQIYKTMLVRHGLMIVGRPCGGKTTAYKVLAQALEKLHLKNLLNENRVEYTIINPKSMTSGQLYGHFDAVSHEWIDGVLAVAYRNYASSLTQDRKWIIFDGPVDAVWIENMNTVLDDNKKLCLTSGEIIQLSPTTNLIFETLDLETASPATVSRCGMIYIEPELLGWRPTYRSWLQTLPETLKPLQKKTLEEMFERFVDPCLALVNKIKELCPTSPISLVSSLINLLDKQLEGELWNDAQQSERDGLSWMEGCFIFSLVWSIGATCYTEGQVRFDNLIKLLTEGGMTEEMRIDLGLSDLIGAPTKDLCTTLPRNGLIYDYYFVKQGSGAWLKWSDNLKSSADEPDLLPVDPMGGVIVPTVETLKFNHLAKLLVGSHKVPLFVGPTGTGKSAYILDFLQNNKEHKWLKIQLSSQTKANNIQSTIMLSIDRRKKATYGPSGGSKMITFVDDLNAPIPEKYGAQPPIELLRQFLDHGHWFDLKEATPIHLVDIHLIAAMGISGASGGRVTPRFLRHCSIVSINEFEDSTLKTIYRTILDSHFVARGFSGEFRSFTDSIISGTLSIFKEIKKVFLPTPSKPHYMFNLRDFDRVIKGMQLTIPEAIDEVAIMKRLWIHEIFRVFHDRLVSEEDRMWIFNLIKETSNHHLRDNFDDLLHHLKFRLPVSSRKSIDVEQLFIQKTGLDGLKECSSQSSREVTLTDMRSLMFCDFVDAKAEAKNYSEVCDTEGLKQVVEGYLEEYNNFSRSPMNLVLFRFAVEHISRISRIIRQPGGHALLVGLGGSGRRSLARLTGFMADYEVMQIEVTKSYGIAEWQDDLKKILMKSSEKHVLFLLSDTQIKHKSFIEDITNLLNSGEVPNLFQTDEKAEICERMKSIDRQREKTKQVSSAESMYNLFIQVCRSQLHVVLTFSPVGETFRNRIRNFPSLVNCCTVDWFERWPSDALEAVAEKSLRESNFFTPVELKKVIATCQSFHLDVVELSQKYQEQLNRYNYVTPTSYLELLNIFKNLYEKKNKEVNQLQMRYRTGLERLRMAAEEISVTKHELSALQPRLVESSHGVAEIMKDIERESQGVIEVEKLVRIDEGLADKQAQEAREIKEECDKDLSYAMPSLEAAIRALNTISQNDISVIKAMKNPPPGVRLIMEAICILKGIRPDRVPDLTTGKMTEDYWKPSLRLLGDLKFMESLINYDKDNIPPNIMKQIRTKYCTNPDFDPDKINKVSSACEGLCKWVIAMDKYDSAAKVVAPKKEALKLANQKLSMANADLKQKRESLRKVQEKLNDLKENLDQQKRKKIDLENKADMCTRKISRAEQLIEGLGGERVRWSNCDLELENFKVNLLGDILISAGMVAYLGAFTPNFRQTQAKAWTIAILDMGIACSENFSLIATLGDQVTIRSWLDNQLPTDNYSIENGIIIANTNRWPLVIDPQDQFVRFVRNSERENNVKIVKITSPDLLRSLENCMQFGTPLLLEGVDEWLDPILDPILTRQTIKQPGGTLCIKLGDSTVEYCPDFRLYISTRIRNPHFLPETSVKVTLINFMITNEGLADQLLGIVVAREMPRMEEEKRSLIVTSAKHRKDLRDLENKILEVLSSSGSDLLEDETAIQILSSSERLANEIKEKQAVAEATEASIDKAREEYRVIAEHATNLFFTISDLVAIDTMYQYSLEWFIKLYLASIDKAEKYDLTSDIDRGSDLTATFLADLWATEEGKTLVHKRLEALKLHFTYSLHCNICRSLFEKDKLLFSFLLSINLLRKQSKINTEEWQFFLLGSRGQETFQSKPASWLTPKAWNDICVLDQMEKFSGIKRSFVLAVDKWREIYDSQQPHLETFPLEFEDKLGLFQKLLIIRCLRPDKVILGLMNFVTQTLGSEFTQPPTFDLEESFKDSNSLSPLIFILSPGSDPVSGLLKFAETKGFGTDQFASLSLGRGQGPLGMNMIEKASVDGTWVLLQNCHLAPSWMPSLERIIENLDSGKVHSDFRLWLTSYPCQDFPASLLQNGVKMTCEPAKGLKHNMLTLLCSNPINKPDFWENSIENNKVEWKRMLFGLVYFHALVQERRTFGPIGWNVHYEFNEPDFRISLQRLKAIFTQYKEVQYEALFYMTGECDYGGRVTDHWDRRTLMTLLKRFYSPPDEINLKYSSHPGVVHVNENMEHDSFMELVHSFPSTSHPNVFGLHENASISRNTSETKQLFSSILLTQSNILTSSLSGKQNSFESTAALATEILEKISSTSLNIERASKKYPTDREQSMNTVLIQEMVRYNSLLLVIKTSLNNVRKAIQGQVVMTTELEEVVKSLMIGKIPEMWKKKSFPSLKPLGSYVNNLMDRLKFLNDWLEDGLPGTFWISGFFFTQAFLTGVQQNYARKHCIAIDLISFNYEILEELAYDRQPDDGAFIKGLFIEGARWNGHDRLLSESEPGILYTEMPTIWIKPCLKENLISSGVYPSPLYKTSERKGHLSTTGHSTNFVAVISIPSSQSEDHWVERGVALLCQLDD